MISRRSFLPIAAAPLLRGAGKQYPVGLEMYSVRAPLKNDLEGSIRTVAQMGYRVMEFYGSYYSWTTEKATGIRRLLDDLNVACHSTHNDAISFSPDGIQKAIDLNHILGSRYVVLASAGNHKDLDGYKRAAELLSKASDRFAVANLRVGVHNDAMEFTPLDGQRPFDILAANTPADVMLQLDVGHCAASGGDPAEFIRAHPGRIRSLHLKEWSPEAKFEAIIGDGIVPWKQVFEAAETIGGVEYYLIEHEGHVNAPFEPVRESLARYRRLHG